jgi:hypothetical protein
MDCGEENYMILEGQTRLMKARSKLTENFGASSPKFSSL